MTVGELKRSLVGVADDLPVYVYQEEPPKTSHGIVDYMFYVTSAKRVPESAIGNESFDITTGGGFGW